MPKKKTAPAEQSNTGQENLTDSGKEKKTETMPEAQPDKSSAVTPVEPTGSAACHEVVESPQKKGFPWANMVISLVFGLLLGVLVSYFFMVKPVQDQLAVAAGLLNDDSASNQIKSDLTNTRLRQQEMEIRYLKSAAQLESANQYIFLLRIKEQVSIARLQLEQKDGFEARETMAGIKTLFDQLRPFIEKKDKATADDLESLIKTSIQDLTGDPEQAKTDLEGMASHLDTVEMTLFQME